MDTTPPESAAAKSIRERYSRRERHVCDLRDEIAAAAERGDWAAAKKAAHELHLSAIFAATGERDAATEAEEYAVELSRYRPTRAAEKPAPGIDGGEYVTTAATRFVCVAKSVRRTLQYDTFSLDHYVPDVKTECGKKTLYPVRERQSSGGWPRLREVCPDCVRRLIAAGKWQD